LVRVFTKQGKKEWLLIHIEVQGYSQAVFARRMFTYYSRLMDKYQIPVTCMALFLGKRNKNNAAFFETSCLGSTVRFDFNAYYVGEQREEILEEHTNPFAVVILTALTALKYRKSTADLFNSKVAL